MGVFNPGLLAPSRVRYAFDGNKKIFSGLDLDEFETRLGPNLSFLGPWRLSGGLVARHQQVG